MQAQVVPNESELNVIKQSFDRMDFDPETTLTVDVERGKFTPTLSAQGRPRDKRDMAWAIDHILTALDTIGWKIYEVHCNCEDGRVDFHICPVEIPTENKELAEINFEGEVCNQ